jgi:hypothetical protein
MEARVRLTSSCKDCDSIPKVDRAGEVAVENGEKTQFMFNGLKIYHDSYHSPWMNQIIYNLKGHHEPQEELVFYHLVRLLKSDSNMIELGSAWAYYSMFFRSINCDGFSICVEPNPTKLSTGVANVKLNKFDSSQIKFINGFIGSEYSEKETFCDWDKSQIEIPRYSVEKLISDTDVFFDVIHSDIQGAELEMLEGAIPVLERIGFFVISTHGNKHDSCLEFLQKNNFQVLVQHSIAESYSADGLILAVNSDHIETYEAELNGSLKGYFDEKCKIAKRPYTSRMFSARVMVGRIKQFLKARRSNC